MRRTLLVRRLAPAALLVFLAAGGCDPGSPGEEGASGPPAITSFLAGHRIVDLTHAFGGETVYWPTAPSGFELDTLAYGETPGGWFYSAFRLSAPEHGGTHLDAPLHFARGRHATHEVPLDRLVGPAVVLDVSEAAAVDPDYRLTPDDVRRFEAEHGRISEGAIVLLRTGWAERWPDVERYLGDDTAGDASGLHFPSFGPEATRLLVEERGVAALGADVASIDPGDSDDFPVHRIALGANVPGFENLTNLEALPPTGALVVALPTKIRGGSGAPLRAVAFVPREGE